MGREELDLSIDNLKIEKSKNLVFVSVNPKFYNLDVVYSAIYTLLDRCYVKVDGDPNEEIIVEIKPKKKSDLELLGREFNNELINYAVIGIRSENTESIRKAIVERALKSHEIEDSSIEKKLKSQKINIPWEKDDKRGE